MERFEDIAHETYQDEFEERISDWLNQGYSVEEAEVLERQQQADQCSCGRFIDEEAHYCSNMDCPHRG